MRTLLTSTCLFLGAVNSLNATGSGRPAAIPAFFYRSAADGALHGRAVGLNVSFPPAGVDLTGRTGRVRIRFIGGDPGVVAQAGSPTGGTLNLISGAARGAWEIGLHVFDSVCYRSIYPGIDVRFGGDGHLLKSEYHVARGVNPADIRVLYDGAQKVSANPDGSLRVEMAAGVLTEAAPLAYQQTSRGTVKVTAKYLVDGTGGVRFELGGYDPTVDLVIDPTLAFSTYVGGSGADMITAAAVDSSGNVYVTGYTDSADFPVRGALQTWGGSVDAFVVKISANGDRFLFATYIGGSGYDQAFGIAVDASGRAVVTGSTTSVNFPILNAQQSSNAGGKDAFVIMLNAAGSALVFSTFFGGSGADSANAVALGPSGTIYVAGDTTSTNLPVLSAFQGTNKGRQDAFAAKFSSAGALLYSTYVGGTGDDKANAIAVDVTGAAYIAGETSSPDLPASTGFQKANAGGQDAFIAKLSSNGSVLVYGSYLGGAGGVSGQPESAYGIVVDSSSNAYVAGVTSSPGFPIASAYQPTFGGGGTDAFVAKVNASGSALMFSTFLGGVGDDSARSITLEPSGSIAVVGTTFSVNFPCSGALQATKNGQKDAFVARLSAGGTDLLMATYVGGAGIDTANAVASTLSGDLWVAGQTTSGDFPLVQPLESFGTPEGNAFVLKIVSPSVPATPSNPSPTAGATGTVLTSVLTWSAVAGATSYDVYFGTSMTPSFAVNTATTSYNPGLLNGSTVYYWRVIAKNSSGTAASPVWLFTTLACTYTLSPGSVSLTGTATGSVTVTTPGGCPWTAASNVSWTSISSGATGAGTGAVGYSATINPGSSPRIGTLTIAGLTFTMTQAGTPGAKTPTAAIRDATGNIRLSTFGSTTVSNSGGVFAGDPSAAQDASGNTYVAVRDNSNSIWVNIFSSTTSNWSGWRFGGGVLQGTPAISVDVTGKAWIAIRDTYNSYWLVGFSAGNFVGWTALYGTFSTDPILTACGDGSVYVIGKDTFNSMWSGRYIPGSGFQGWQFGGGIVKGKPSATCGGDNAVYVAVEDNFNSNWVARIAGNTWTGWSYGGAVTSVTPRIAAVGGGNEAVMILDNTGVVWMATYKEGTGNGWQPWVQVGGVLQDVAPGGGGGQLFLAGKASNGDVWWWQQTGNQWTLGGNIGVGAGSVSVSPR